MGGCHQMSRPLRVGEKTHRCALDWSTEGYLGKRRVLGARPHYVARVVSEQSCKQLMATDEAWITPAVNISCSGINERTQKAIT